MSTAEEAEYEKYEESTLENLPHMPNEQLKLIWKALEDGWDSHTLFDNKRNITMNDWATAVLSEIELRGLKEDER